MVTATFLAALRPAAGAPSARRSARGGNARGQPGCRRPPPAARRRPIPDRPSCRDRTEGRRDLANQGGELLDLRHVDTVDRGLGDMGAGHREVALHVLNLVLLSLFVVRGPSGMMSPFLVVACMIVTVELLKTIEGNGRLSASSICRSRRQLAETSSAGHATRRYADSHERPRLRRTIPIGVAERLS